MKNSMFIFAAALFLMTSCTLNEEDIPQPINQTEQNDFQASDYRNQFKIYKGLDAELSEKKNRNDLKGKQDYRARFDTLSVSGSAYAVKRGVGHGGVSAIAKRSYRENFFELEDAKISTRSGVNQQKGEPSTEGFGSGDALTVIPNKDKMD